LKVPGKKAKGKFHFIILNPFQFLIVYE